MQLSVIAPVYNNAGTLEELVRRLNETLAGLEGGFEIILINDGSRDNSWSLIQSLCVRHSHVVGLNFARNFGQHAGIKAGLHYARGEKVVLMDADLEDEPESLPKMLEAMTEGIDVVYTIVGEQRRRFTSSLFHALTAKFTQSEVAEGVGTLRLFSRRFADALLRYTERRPVWGPIMHALGFRQATIRLPDTGPRRQSGYSFVKRARLAMDVLVANTSVPFSLIFGVALTLFAVSFGYAAVVLAQYLFFGSSAPVGVTLIVFLVLILFAFNFLFLATIGLYVHRVMLESLGRPLFVVANAMNARHLILTDKERPL